MNTPIQLTTIAPNHATVKTPEVLTFFSYDTPVLSQYPGGALVLHPAWKYTSTTSKHRSRFLNGETTKETQTKLDLGIYTLKEYY